GRQRRVKRDWLGHPHDGTDAGHRRRWLRAGGRREHTVAGQDGERHQRDRVHTVEQVSTGLARRGDGRSLDLEHRYYFDNSGSVRTRPKEKFPEYNRAHDRSTRL